MKKLLLSVFILICFTLIVIYLFIPAKVTFSKIIIIKTRASIANRFLMDESRWVKWFPEDSVSSDASSDKKAYQYKKHVYSVENTMMNTVEVSISNNQTVLRGLINMISISEDSVAFEWKCEMHESSNPIQRIRNYFKAKELQKNMGDILKNLQTFLEKKENVYGLNISLIQVMDTMLISTKFISDSFPTTSEIYSLIDDLRKYISKEGGQETNPPMLNITNDSSTYRTMVAIPVNKILPEKDNYVFKRIVPGKILVAEVKGGDYTARQALEQLDLYIEDNHLSSPAIPFESLITNRSLEPDTTKWITKIYYPIY